MVTSTQCSNSIARLVAPSRPITSPMRWLDTENVFENGAGTRPAWVAFVVVEVVVEVVVFVVDDVG